MRETADFGNEYLFVTYEGHKVSDSTVRENIKILGKIARLDRAKVAPHTFRHTGALYNIYGGDPFSLQKILGHSHMKMVRRYVQMTNRDVQTQHAQYSPLNYVFK